MEPFGMTEAYAKIVALVIGETMEAEDAFDCLDYAVVVEHFNTNEEDDKKDLGWCAVIHVRNDDDSTESFVVDSMNATAIVGALEVIKNRVY